MNDPGAWVAVRFEDPAGLLEGARADAILRAHHAVVAAARGDASGADFAPTSSAASTLDAVLLAMRIQTETRLARVMAMATDMGVATAPRLQVVVGIGADEAGAIALCDGAGGGQIVCARAVHDAIEGVPGAQHLEWGPTSRDDVLECLYDDAAALLDEPFERMFAAEVRGWIEPYRLARGVEGGLPVPERPDTRNDLFGIALSGGGMRSAVFSLGVLQAMSRYGLLKDADYLCSVSGGGYAGASLLSLCLEPLPYETPRRLDFTSERFPFAFPRWRFGEPASSAAERSTSLPVHGNESPALHHVRGHARLLGQAIGVFSSYTWRMLTRYVLSAAALWVLFLLPIITLVALGGILIWEAVDGWDRGWLTLAAVSPLLAAAPGVLIGSFTALKTEPSALSQLTARVGGVLRIVAALLAVAVVTTLMIAAVDWIQDENRGGVLGIGGGLTAISSSALVIGLRRVWSPALTTKLLPVLAVAIGGYLLLAIIVLAWHWALFAWTGAEAGAVFWLALVASLAILVVTGVRGWGRAALNALSLHALYRSRIGATWVLAGRSAPPPDDVEGEARSSIWTRVWYRPDITMGSIARAARTYGPASPYPLLCATLSFPGNQGDPKLLDRRGEAFVIAPLYSGSALSRWKPTAEMPDLEHLSLSGAAAVSGAAVSPNMGDRTIATVSVLTTLLNVRLGLWVENPRPSRRTPFRRWLVARPVVMYFKEMLGLASRDDGEVYLSDGGHFENLGLYELLRRRCKYIVAIAADIEPAPGAPLGFGNLGTAARYARVDFGVEITMPALRPMLRDPVTGFVSSYFSVGRIYYPTPGGHAEEGVLVMVKSAIAEDGLSPDLLTYWRNANPGFPYDPTTDQQFDQPQFESYRQIGFIAGRQAFRASRDASSVQGKFESVEAAFNEQEWWQGEVVDAIRQLRGEPT